MRPVARLAVVPLLLAALAADPTAAQEPVVHAVLFYSPTCPHCHVVINEVLPPLRERFGDGLRVVGVDVSGVTGQALYQATVEALAIPASRLGVPTLVVGDQVMVGSLEIPQLLPGIVEAGLAAGGIGWPAVDAVREALQAQGLDPEPTREADPAPTAAAPAPADTAAAASPGPEAALDEAAPVPSTASAPTLDVDLSGGPQSDAPPTPARRFLRDPVGNGVAVGVLVLLVAMLIWAPWSARRGGAPWPRLPAATLPALAVVGLGVAAYLSSVEVTGADAVCGPVGDCNTVQQSPYARLLGVIPVGILGLAGYLTLLATWGVGRRGPPALRAPARRLTWALAWTGTAFSAWLTFLEPFVIGATCAWCVTSALVMAGMLAVATGELRATRPTGGRRAPAA